MLDLVGCLFSCKPLQTTKNTTVLRDFLAATGKYGLSSRVRVDHGGESKDVCDLIELLHGRGCGRVSALPCPSK